MKNISRPIPRHRRKAPTRRFSQPVIFFLVFAACGWLILIANMFGLAGLTGWIFPVIDDIPGLALSTLLIALIGLAPVGLRQVFPGKKLPPS